MEINDLYEQNSTIISLLGRLAFPEDALKKIIMRKKQNPSAYVRAYNAFDGTKGVTEIAKIAGVSQPTMTSILQSWKRIGIVYQTNKTYMKLYSLSEDREVEKNDQAGRDSGENTQENGLDSQTNAETTGDSK